MLPFHIGFHAMIVYPLLVDELENLRKHMDFIKRAQEVLDTEIDGLQHVRSLLDGSFEKAVRLILDCLQRGGKVVISGVGKSLQIGQKMAATFTSTGTPSVTLHPSEALHGDLGILDARDVLLALSYSGSTEELIRLLPIARRLGVRIVSITGVRDSPLARHSDAVISATVQREACPFNMAPTASTTVTLALGDALAMVLLEARGFNQDDYAKLHPGGAIGRALLTRVCDVMRTGNRMAKVMAGSRVKDAVLAMTSSKSGSVAVVDAKDKLLGIFTDGDLRRHLTDTDQITDLVIDEVMTCDPVTLHEDDLAVDILHMFEHHSIDDLVVLNNHGVVVGQVDIQDLPKFKIL